MYNKENIDPDPNPGFDPVIEDILPLEYSPQSESPNSTASESSFEIPSTPESTSQFELTDDSMDSHRNSESLVQSNDRLSAYQCNKCDSNDNTLNGIQSHMGFNIFEKIEYEEKVIFVCNICYAQHTSAETLRSHIVEDHKYIVIRSNNADDDNDNDDDKTSLMPTDETKINDKKSEPATIEMKNMQNDEIDKKYDCEENSIAPVPFKDFKKIVWSSLTHKCTLKGCSFKFESDKKLEIHLKCHLSKDADKIRIFKCVECDLECSNWRVCARHMWNLHEIDVDLLSCPLCPFKAMACVRIWNHMKSHKRWKSKVLRSKKAKDKKDGKEPVFKNKYYVQKICEICDRKFANGKTLSKHVKSVHNKIKPFICNVCGQKCSRKSILMIHMRQHTGEKPHSCKTCPFATRDPSVLKVHELRHEKEDLKHKCSCCKYTSVQTANLKKHIKLNHPDKFKEMSCDLCNYTSVRPERLAAHKQDHKKGIIRMNDDSMDATRLNLFKNPTKQEKHLANNEISSDCFLPIESTDSIAHDLALDSGGVTIPANSEDTQFPTFLNN